jgi:hypothetical protein
MIKDKKSNKEQSCNVKCISMKNMKSMEVCNKTVSTGDINICGTHKKRKLLYLSDGTILKNIENSDNLNYSVYRNKLKFWEIISSGIQLSKLNSVYVPSTLSKLRDEKVSYLIEELKRLNVNIINISEDRYYWFINLLYYLGNFTVSVKKIQRFYRGPFQIKLKKRKEAVQIIWKYYLNYKLKKLLPIFIKNSKILKNYNCINICDPITQETFMEVSADRWVICEYNDNEVASERKNITKINNCWWFDIVSAVQLLGSPGSHSGENPFNRREYPPEFLFDIEEKLYSLKNKYLDVMNLIVSIDENKNSGVIPVGCYCYFRFQIHIKANKLFESFKEIGYFFSRGIFLKYDLGELRSLTVKIYESWSIINIEERKRFFPPYGHIYPPEIVNKIINLGGSSSSILLKTTILDALLTSITYQQNYEDRLYGCLKTLTVLGTINEESHEAIRENGLCDCNGSHIITYRQTPMNILENIMAELIE